MSEETAGSPPTIEVHASGDRSVAVGTNSGVVTTGDVVQTLYVVERRDRFDRVARRFGLQSGWGAARIARRHRAWALGAHSSVDQTGLRITGSFTPELDDVFVDVSLEPRPPHHVARGLLGDAPSGRRALEEFIDQARPAVLAVTGPPGSGKTTLLRHIYRKACREHRKRRRTIPILLYLRMHLADITSAEPDDLPELLGRLPNPGPADWWRRQLQAGHCVVLLDGLDEVAQPRDRRQVSRWVESQIAAFRKNDFVVTSRPQGYQAAAIGGARILQVQRFTQEQISRFVHRWYDTVEKNEGTAPVADVHAERAASDILGRIDDSADLRDLAVNPLLLTMIVNVHRFLRRSSDKALPRSRSDLYREICRVVLNHRAVKGLPTSVVTTDQEAALQRLAFTMTGRQVRELPRPELLDVIAAAASADTAVPADDLLTEIHDSGLLVESETGRFSFAHQTFQEYLTAVHIERTGEQSLLVSLIEHDWWRESILFCAASGHGDSVVQACLDANTPSTLALAFDCADQQNALNPNLRERVDGLLTDALAETGDREVRRVVARALLRRHLRRQIPLAEGQIARHPISVTLYRLFMLDTADEHEPRTPDRDLPCSGDEPVVGVRAGDAIAFTRWVNELLGDAEYRLPTQVEIAESHTRLALDPDIGLWVRSQHDALALWSGDHADTTVLTVDHNELVGCVEQDLTDHAVPHGLMIRSLQMMLAELIDWLESQRYLAATLDDLDAHLTAVFKFHLETASRSATADTPSTLDGSFGKNQPETWTIIGILKRIYRVAENRATARAERMEHLGKLLNPLIPRHIVQKIGYADKQLRTELANGLTHAANMAEFSMRNGGIDRGTPRPRDTEAAATISTVDASREEPDEPLLDSIITHFGTAAGLTRNSNDLFNRANDEAGAAIAALQRAGITPPRTEPPEERKAFPRPPVGPDGPRTWDTESDSSGLLNVFGATLNGSDFLANSTNLTNDRLEADWGRMVGTLEQLMEVDAAHYGSIMSLLGRFADWAGDLFQASASALVGNDFAAAVTLTQPGKSSYIHMGSTLGRTFGSAVRTFATAGHSADIKDHDGPVRSADNPSNFHNTFSRQFVAATEFVPPERQYGLDRLGEKLSNVQNEVMRLIADVSAHDHALFLNNIIDLLVGKAMPVFTRQAALTRKDAGSIRLAALCLAAELDNDSPKTAERLRELVCAVILLERRLCSAAPPTETIVIATS